MGLSFNIERLGDFVSVSLNFNQNDLGSSSPFSLHDFPNHLKAASEKRKNEFLLGRMCCAKSIYHLDNSLDQFVGVHSDRSPKWPIGIVGSITHSSNYVEAIACLATSGVLSVGVDYEEVISLEEIIQVEGLVLTPNELESFKVIEFELSKEIFLTLLFSAKESIFKCLYPLVNVYFDFLDVEISMLNFIDKTFSYKLLKDLSDVYRKNYCNTGKFFFDRNSVRTTTFIRAHA